MALRDFNQLYDSDGLTPFCHTYDQNNVPLMKTLMDTFKDKVDEQKPNFTTFSKFMLCYVTTNDAQWATEHLDTVLFEKNEIHESQKPQEYGTIRAGCRFVKEYSPKLHQETVDRCIKDDAMDGKLIFFEVSTYPIITVPGSEQSLELIETLLNAKDEIFDTKVTLLIEEKWERVESVIIRNNFIYFFYMAMVTALIVFEGVEMFYILELILAYQALLLAAEVSEMWRQGLDSYFNDVTNWFDLIQGVCIFVYGAK